jgi:hypothetical protein
MTERTEPIVNDRDPAKEADRQEAVQPYEPPVIEAMGNWKVVTSSQSMPIFGGGG